MHSEDFTRNLAEIRRLARKYNPNANLDMIEEAFRFSEKCHENQFRKSGDPYFSHPVAVAKSLAEKGMDEVVISAALLHDVLEDSKVTEARMQKIFGKQVTGLVRGVTKLDMMRFRSRQEQSTANALKTIIAASKDIRVLLIKLYDKLHNMRTLRFLPKEKQKRIAIDALSVYVPLAHKLGIHGLKYEMEDLCFETLEPKKYRELCRKIGRKVKAKSRDIKKTVALLKKSFPREKWRFETKAKSAYLIYSKIKVENRSLEEINDELILKIIVEKKDECYSAMGKMHSLFKPIPGKVKDYIAIPEHGIYESLHTQVLGPSKKPLKIYFFSAEMDEVADDGVMALMRNGKPEKKELLDKYSKMFSSLKEPEIRNPKQLSDSLNLGLHHRAILAFTPEGGIVDLPHDSTVLDFAFFYDEKNAKRASKAKVNEKIVPLWKKINSGDRVKIFYSNSTQLDSDWLFFANAGKTKGLVEKELRKHKPVKKSAKAGIRLRVDSVDRPGILSRQLAIIAKNGLDLESMNARMYGDRTTCTNEIVLRNRNGQNFQKAVKELRELRDTLNVTVDY